MIVSDINFVYQNYIMQANQRKKFDYFEFKIYSASDFEC